MFFFFFFFYKFKGTLGSDLSVKQLFCAGSGQYANNVGKKDYKIILT